MNYRIASILAQKTVTTAGTETVDINLKDPISRLYVKYNHTNGDHYPDAHPAKIVSKVEVVDGSEVLASLSGQQIEALNFFDTKETRGKPLEYRNGCVGEIVLPINFGRFRYDPQLALDPTKFRNPQIKVSHDIANGGSSVSSSTMEIFADVFDEKVISPVGFLMSKEWFIYTLSDNQYKSVDLPLDHILKRLVLFSQTYGYELDDQLAEIKLSEENDKRIPIDLDIADLMRLAAARYGQYVEEMACCFEAVDAETWYVTPCSKLYCNPSPIGSLYVYTGAERMGGDVYFDAPEGIVSFKAHLSGFEPHGALPVDFGDQSDPDDWFDVTRLGSLILRLKDGSSPSGTCAVVTQQLRRY